MVVRGFGALLVRGDQTVGSKTRTVDKAGLVKRLGRLGEDTQAEVLAALGQLFAP